MVGDEIEQDANPAVVSGGDQPVHVRERPEHRVDIHIVRDVVAKICHG